MVINGDLMGDIMGYDGMISWKSMGNLWDIYGDLWKIDDL